jgi:hypothetical protein
MFAPHALSACSAREALCPTAPVVARLPELRVCEVHAPERARFERHIRDVFARVYGADIHGFMPLLAGLEEAGAVLAAFGLRSAAREPLFCEQYLDHPVEHYARTMYGTSGERRRIMELGNLAVTRAGHSGIVYLVIAAALRECGVDHLLFAANRAVRRSVDRCGFSPRPIQAAHPDRLTDGGQQWGSYYASGPVVMLGDVSLTLRQAARQPGMVALLAHYAGAIEQLALAMERLRA